MESKNAQKNQVDFANEFWFDHFKEKKFPFLGPNITTIFRMKFLNIVHSAV